MGDIAAATNWRQVTGSWRRLAPLLLAYMGSTGSLMIGSAAQLLTFAILARALGVAQFGTYTVLVAVTNIAVQFCGLGGSETLVRRVAQDPASYAVALGHNLILIALTGLPLVVGLAAVLPGFVQLGGDPLVNGAALLAFVFTNLVLVRFILLAEAIHLAHLRVNAANGVNLGYALGRTATASVACLVFRVARVEAFVFWLFAGHAVVALGCAWSLRGLGRPRWTLMRDEIKLGFYFCTPYIFQALRQSADLLVLNVVAPPEVVGSFSMARRILDTSALSATALYRMTYPRMARATQAGLRAAWPLIVNVLKLAVGIAVVTSIGTFVAASAMPWLFGRDFGRMVGFLHLMCWALIPVTVHTVAAEALGASAMHWARAALYNGGSLAGAGLAALLTWLLNIEGTFTALYVVEISLAVAFWSTLTTFLRRESRDAAGSAQPSEA